MLKSKKRKPGQAKPKVSKQSRRSSKAVKPAAKKSKQRKASTRRSKPVQALQAAAASSYGEGLLLGPEGKIEWAPADVSYGPFLLKASTPSGNPHIYLSYNTLPGTWELVNPDDRGLLFGQEADYDDGSGNNKMEQYWQFQIASGFGDGSAATYRRTVFAQYDKVTALPTALFLSSGVTQGVMLCINDGTGSADQQQVIGKLKAQLTKDYFSVWNQPGGSTTGFLVTAAASAATGVQVNCAAAGSGAGMIATSSGANENLNIDAKGSGSVVLGRGSTGPVQVGQSAGTTSEATNRGNLTLYSGQVDASTNGLEFKSSSAAAGFGFRIATVYDGGSNMDLKFQNRQNSASWTDIFKFAGSNGTMTVAASTATPAGGSAAARLLLGTTPGLGIYFGSGVPTVSAAQGSLYMRTDGSSASTRMYVNTNGSTGWTAVTTAT